MEKFGLELDQKSKQLIVKKNYFVKKNYAKIGINTNYNLPLNKPPNFPTLTIIIRCVFQEGKELYREIYLDECFY